MIHPRFEYMWRFLREHAGCVEGDVSADLLCIVCKGVLINAQVALCGCRFCRDCIIAYLGDREGAIDTGSSDRRACPGARDDCKAEQIDIDEQGGFYFDAMANKSVSRLLAKCPRQHCPIRCELAQMEAHERVCEGQLVSCPYASVGCTATRLARDSGEHGNAHLDEHLSAHARAHAHLLVASIEALRSEIGSVRTELVESVSQIGEMRARTQPEREEGHVQHVGEAVRAMQTALASDEQLVMSSSAHLHGDCSEMLARIEQEVAHLRSENDAIKQHNLALHAEYRAIQEHSQRLSVHPDRVGMTDTAGQHKQIEEPPGCYEHHQDGGEGEEEDSDCREYDAHGGPCDDDVDGGDYPGYDSYCEYSACYDDCECELCDESALEGRLDKMFTLYRALPNKVPILDPDWGLDSLSDPDSDEYDPVRAEFIECLQYFNALEFLYMNPWYRPWDVNVHEDCDDSDVEIDGGHARILLEQAARA